MLGHLDRFGWIRGHSVARVLLVDHARPKPNAEPDYSRPLLVCRLYHGIRYSTSDLRSHRRGDWAPVDAGQSSPRLRSRSLTLRRRHWPGDRDTSTVCGNCARHRSSGPRHSWLRCPDWLPIYATPDRGRARLSCWPWVAPAWFWPQPGEPAVTAVDRAARLPVYGFTWAGFSLGHRWWSLAFNI